jgi:hypothetical protein
MDNSAKVVRMVMDLVGMNFCWGAPKGQVILLDLWQLWQIACMGHPSQITFYTSREKRVLGLPIDLLIVLA